MCVRLGEGRHRHYFLMPLVWIGVLGILRRQPLREPIECLVGCIKCEIHPECFGECNVHLKPLGPMFFVTSIDCKPFRGIQSQENPQHQWIVLEGGAGKLACCSLTTQEVWSLLPRQSQASSHHLWIRLHSLSLFQRGLLSSKSITWHFLELLWRHEPVCFCMYRQRKCFLAVISPLNIVISIDHSNNMQRHKYSYHRIYYP